MKNDKNKLTIKIQKELLTIPYLSKENILNQALGTLFSPRQHFLGDS